MATLYELTGQAAQLMELLEAGEIDEQTVQRSEERRVGSWRTTVW